MLSLYLVSILVAGVLIVLSLFGGDHEVGHDTDFHIEHDTDSGHDGDHGPSGYWIPFFSLRFYTYFFAGLGLTGLLLTYGSHAPATLTLILSIVMAFVSGLSVWLMVKLLRRSENTSTATEQDILGTEGVVTVPILGQSPGRIRCTVKGDIIDFLAVTEGGTPLNPGDSVVIVAMESGRVQVVPTADIFGHDVLPSRTS